ncbi:MAG TPA: MlaD family protein [Methylomirabilota bacterium]|nr:MlaD family protein [Methylomirabilota bacterium]
MNEERSERGLKLRVGVFVLVALAAFLGMIYALGARARLFEARYTIHADFTEVGGLAEGATVRLAGVQIGRVSGVHLPGEPGGKVRVDLTIARRYADRIRKDSAARIETQGLLGDKIVEITVGTPRTTVVQPGETIAARDPTDITQVINESAVTVKNVAALADRLRELAEGVAKAKIIDDVSAATASARRAADQLARLTTEVEKGRGWAHALIYEEPVALKRLGELVASTGRILERAERGEGALGVLTSRQSTESARKFLAAMDRVARLTEGPRAEDGLLPALLFDPKYRAVLDDLQAVTRNLREVSDRVVGGRGTLGSLVKDESEDGKLRSTMEDLQVAVANLKEITEKINEGEGTLGALIADPTIYERLAAILDGTQRSVILRSLIRNLGKDQRDGTE